MQTGKTARLLRWSCLNCFSLARPRYGHFSSLILWSCSSHPWPDHRSVASFAHERLRYRRRAARQRTKRSTDFSRFSFWAYLSVCGGRSICRAHPNRGRWGAVDDFQARGASLPWWNGRMMSESAWEVKKEENWARLSRAQGRVFAATSDGNFSVTLRKL